MSWLTDIAGKAEDLLNRVDQTAATALQNKSKTPLYKSDDRYLKSSRSDVAFESSFSAGSAFASPQNVKTSKFSRPESKNLYNPTISTPRKKPESDDEKLLRFLNSNEGVSTEQRKSVKSAAKPKELPMSTIETTDVAINITEMSTEEQSQSLSTAENENAINETKAESSSTSGSKTPENSEIPIDSIKVTDVTDGENSESDKSSFHGDIVEVEKRALYAEAEMKRMMKKLDHWNSQISSNDKLVRELKEREKDMIAAMDAKDSQLAILKVRLQEADQELMAKHTAIEELTAENERIVKDHAEGASFQNKTVEVLRDQLQQAEAELHKTKDSLHQTQIDHMNQRSKMEEEHRHLVESYTSLQKKWNDISERNRDLLSQLKSANANFETLQHEYNDYKLKAQRILQTKEKLISNLKEGVEGDSTEKIETSSALLNAEVDSVKQERDLLKEELRRSNELIENYRYEVQELEKTSQNDLATSQERCKILKEQFDMEKVQREELQLLTSQLKEEVELLRDDLATTKNSFQSRIQDREIEIEKLRRQLTAKSLSTVSQDELESRLHALTENLIQKQTVVEALSTEKNSLVLQLERLEQQLREAQNYGAQQHTYVGINNNDTDRKAKSVYLDSPFDSAMTRKVKRVYGTIDALSIRLGVFFRRYPITRVFVIIYMILLHFWVLTVLLTYEPEVHNSGYEHVKQ